MTINIRQVYRQIQELIFDFKHKEILLKEAEFIALKKFLRIQDKGDEFLMNGAIIKKLKRTKK